MAKNLGSKAVTLFDLCSKLLSQQRHYDWGLRALIPILESAYKLKTSLDEENALLQAIKINCLSKLTDEDKSQFLEILKDFFKGQIAKNNGSEEFAEKAKISCKKLGLTYTKDLYNKICELHEQLDQRMGVLIVGPSNSGKSTLWKILTDMISSTCHIINAKAMPRQKLLGSVNPDTREWTDGVLTSASRQSVLDFQNGKKSIIVCDSDIDPNWIEALNSVLDNNRLLTLPSGERIQFPSPGVNFIFETDDLSPASPATISRMGVIFMSEDDVELDSVLKSLKVPKSAEWTLEELVLLAKDVFKKYTFTRQKVTVANDFLSSLKTISSKQEFAYAVGMSCYFNADAKSRKAIFSDIVSRYGLACPNPSSPASCYLFKNTLQMLHTSTDIEKSTGLVKTNSLATQSNYIGFLLKTSLKPICLISPVGSARKTAVKSGIQLSGLTLDYANLSCSYGTVASDLVNVIQRSCIAVSGGRVLRPKRGQRLIVHIENLPLCKKDEWGSCEIVNLLQQMLTHNGFYNNSQMWVGLEKIQFIFTHTDPKKRLSERFNSLLRFSTASDVSAEKMTILDNLTEKKARIKISDLEHTSFTEISSIKNLSDGSKIQYQLDQLMGISNDSFVFVPERKPVGDFIEQLKTVKRQFSREVKNYEDIHLTKHLAGLVGSVYNSLDNEGTAGVILAGKVGSGRKTALNLGHS